MFKPTIDQLLVNTESAEFMGLNISFKSTKGFTGDLSPKALYYLIGSSDGGNVRYENESIKYIDELENKNLVDLVITEETQGSPEMRGTWAELTPTNKGKQLLSEMGIEVVRR